MANSKSSDRISRRPWITRRLARAKMAAKQSKGKQAIKGEKIIRVLPRKCKARIPVKVGTVSLLSINGKVPKIRLVKVDNQKVPNLGVMKTSGNCKARLPVKGEIGAKVAIKDKVLKIRLMKVDLKIASRPAPAADKTTMTKGSDRFLPRKCKAQFQENKRVEDCESESG